MKVVYQMELQIQICLKSVLEYILILTEDEFGTHGVNVTAEGFANIYRVKENV